MEKSLINMIIIMSGILLMFFCGTIGSCVIHEDYRVSQLVAKGINPVEARMSMDKYLHPGSIAIIKLANILEKSQK